jgi:hypothetical protein
MQWALAMLRGGIVCSIRYNGRGRGTVLMSVLASGHCNVIPFLGTVAFRNAFFGEGTGPIFLERYDDCRRNATRFLDCATRPVGVHSCNHTNDAGVRCIGTSASGIRGSGII